MSDVSARDLAGWELVYSGKVRDLYVPATNASDDDSWTGDPLSRTEVVLVVASDRVSAFDHVLRPGIPAKGELLTQLSLWWFEQVNVPNHLATVETAPAVPEDVARRSMLVAPLNMYPVECVVRGYLTGSGRCSTSATNHAVGTAAADELSRSAARRSGCT